ncbi:5899_t:CDS:2 [Dentiscutata heterogama]|uniref:5899_t:CDS:1 n=1 Tax=Dentiscutata heterogama TaxID=1316150 RepID=A0ACA9KF81_9GLOM|nr:5899_t:CDS:2 [Dentiscutata heterogama]
MAYRGTAQMTVPPMRDEDSPGEWRFNLLGCFDDSGLCVTTFCCPCVTYGRIKDKTNPESGFCLNCVVWCTGIVELSGVCETFRVPHVATAAFIAVVRIVGYLGGSGYTKKIDSLLFKIGHRRNM